jgi:hypothetical protein
MGCQQILAEVRTRITDDRVDVIGAVLGVVELDQEPGTGEAVVMACAGLESPSPPEPKVIRDRPPSHVGESVDIDPDEFCRSGGCAAGQG